MTTFFTADWHLGHKNIIGYSGRPFTSVEQMDRTLAQNWIDIVGPEDTVFFLGDTHLGPWQPAAEILRSLPGRKILLPGNHDECWFGHKRHERWVRKFREEAGFDVILQGTHSYTTLPGVGTVRIAHFPWKSADRTDDRYEEHRPVDDGKSWLLHGHVHEKWRAIKSRRMINVGVDVWNYHPVSAEELSVRIRKGVL